MAVTGGMDGVRRVLSDRDEEELDQRFLPELQRRGRPSQPRPSPLEVLGWLQGRH